MNQEDYLKMYEKYISGQCTPAEEEELYAYMDGFKMQQSDLPDTAYDDSANKDQIFKKINQTIAESKPTVKMSYSWFKYAAAIFLLFTAGYLFTNKTIFKTSASKVDLQAALDKRPIKPGRNTATLTLEDGSILDLEVVKEGTFTSTDGTLIKKSGKGSIIYQGSGDSKAGIHFNKISVPAGGSYTIVLPDGTSVWLNALSSLTYPTTFSDKNREVTLTGEAYFEVAKNPVKPFVAKVNSMKVTVLGTHFNIDAYDSKHYKTTLLEGSVQVSNAEKHAMLKPGQQSLLNLEDANFKISKVNVNKAVAWKNGYFMFQNDDIKDIMGQISRWYDVHVQFEGKISSKTFGGIYSRDKDFNELLKGLELTGLVRFKIEGRRIIVMS